MAVLFEYLDDLDRKLSKKMDYRIVLNGFIN